MLTVLFSSCLSVPFGQRGEKSSTTSVSNTVMFNPYLTGKSSESITAPSESLGWIWAADLGSCKSVEVAGGNV